MVNLKEVRISNRSLQALPPGLVAVFAGATDGIGLGTLRQFAKYVNGPIAFIIGRSEAKAEHIIHDLKKLNPMGNFHFIEGQVSLIHEIDRVAEEIKRLAIHVDMLFMSPGYLTFENKETSEGIETSLALEYYSRIRLTMDLLPLLKLSTSPRVISVFDAGNETKIDSENLDAINKLPAWKAVGPAATMTILAFEELAKENPTISFVHTYPGWVNTNIMDHFFANVPGIWWGLAQIPRYTIFPVLRRLVFITSDEAGERTLFLATSARYPPAVDHERAASLGGWVERPTGVTVAESTIMHEGKGNGVYRTYWNGNVLKENRVLYDCRKEGVEKSVLEHTVAVFEQALTKNANVPHTKEQCSSLSSEDSFDFEVEL